MNKYQRAVLIGVGLIIAVIQLYGINENGLYESRGWAVSFLISAILLFIGFGSWPNFSGLFKNKTDGQIEQPVEIAKHANPPPKKNAPAPAAAPAPIQSKTHDKYEFGIHISELDLAIATHKKYSEKMNLFVPLAGNGRTLNWNCCASVYASMRYAARKTDLHVHSMVWNTIVRAIVIRMSTEENKDVGMGHPDFEKYEKSAYSDIEVINKSVEDAIAGKGTFEFEPIVNTIALMFGSRGEAVKALSVMILENAKTAQKKILPELLADLT